MVPRQRCRLREKRREGNSETLLALGWSGLGNSTSVSRCIFSQDHSPNRGAGEAVTIKIRQEHDGNNFDYYINGEYSATAKDSARHFPKSENWYVGFFLRGEELNNEIDEFSLTYIQKPGIAPEAPALIAAQEKRANAQPQFYLSPNYPNPFRHST